MDTNELFRILMSRAQTQPERVPAWLVLVAYLAFLRATRPQPTTEAVVLRTLIVVVGLVLCVVAMAAAGAPEVAAELLKHWPALP